MKEFFLNLIDANNSKYSSKRFSGLVALFTIISFAISAAIKSNGVLPEYMFNSLILYSAGAFGITAVETIFKKNDIPTQPIAQVEDAPEQPIQN